MSTMSLRRVLLFERNEYADHLKRLGPGDRILRFELPASDAYIDRYVDRVHFVQDAVFGAFDDTLRLRGAAHVAIADRTADLGLSVESGWRGRGIGTRLLDRAIAHARLHGAERMFSMCLASNDWMVRHVTRLGFAVHRDGGVATATGALARPDIGLVQQTLIDEQFGWLDYGTKVWFSLLPHHDAPQVRPPT